MDKSHLSKYPEIEIDKIPNSTNSNMTFPITIEQYYDLMHHTHKASDIIIEGQGTDQIDNIIIDNYINTTANSSLNTSLNSAYLFGQEVYARSFNTLK